MTCRDEEFTMNVAIGYTGLRWGETIGLERGRPVASWPPAVSGKPLRVG